MRATKPPIFDAFGNLVSGGSDPDLFSIPVYMGTGFPAPSGLPVVPELSDFNWLFYQVTNGMRYQIQRGISDWDAAEDGYGTGDIVRYTDNEFYKLVGTATTGTSPVADPTNWVDYLSLTRLTGFLGDGSDGDVTVSGTTHWSASRNANYNSLTIGSSGVLVFDSPYMPRIRGRLSIAAGGKIRFGSLTLLNGITPGGGTLTAATPGGEGGNSLASGSLGSGSSGGSGGWNSSPVGGDGVALGSFRLGGAGGPGGSNGSTPGGAAGASVAFGAVGEDLLTAILAGGRGIGRTSDSPPAAMPFLIMGGSGGGGGAQRGAGPPAPGGGGGGGAGGSVGLIVAREIAIAADGAIIAPGGNAGNGASYFGGGGGGGGYVGIVCSKYSGSALTAAACCPGGTGGISNGGASPAGSNGDVGQVNAFVLG